MSLTSEQRRVQYTQTELGQVMAVPFKFFASTDLVVVMTRAGVDYAQVLNVDYVVYPGANPPATGNIQIDIGQIGDIITIYGDIPETQTVTFTQNGPFFAKTVNDQMDRLTMMIQQQALKTDRAFLAPITQAPISSANAAARSSSVAGYDELGNAIYIKLDNFPIPVPIFINVKSYGAKGDGATDDTLAIATAASAMVPGSVLYFPHGTYITSPFSITVSFTKICGDGLALSVIQAKAGLAAVWVMKLANQITDVTVQGLTIHGNRVNGGTLRIPFIYVGNPAPGALFIDASRVLVTEVEIKEAQGCGCIVASVTARPTDISFDRCYVHDNGGVIGGTDDGLGLSLGIGYSFRPLNVAVRNCRFVNNHNTITTANDSAAILSGAEGLIITGNLFLNNYNVGGAQVVCYSDVTGIGANYVGAVISDNRFILTSRLNTTDVTECVEINGSGYVITDNQCRNSAGTPVSGTQAAFQIDAGGSGDVEISGNMVRDYDVGVGLQGADAVNHVVIANNVFNLTSGATRYGVTLNPAYTNVSILGNDFSACINALPGTPSSTYWIYNNTKNSLAGVGPLTVGASPFTYTAGSCPETIYFVGGTVSSVVMQGSPYALFTATGGAVSLNPHEAITVTYSSLPAMTRVIH